MAQRTFPIQGITGMIGNLLKETEGAFASFEFIERIPSSENTKLVMNADLLNAIGRDMLIPTNSRNGLFEVFFKIREAIRNVRNIHALLSMPDGYREIILEANDVFDIALLEAFNKGIKNVAGT